VVAKVEGLIPLVAAVCSLLLALLVSRRGPTSAQGRVFTALAVALVFWNLNFFALYSISDYELAFSLTRVFRSLAVFLFPTVLYFSLVMPGRGIHATWGKVLFLDYAIAVVLSSLNAFDFFVVELREFAWGYYSVGTPFYDFLSIYLVLNLGTSLTLVLHQFATTSDPRMRVQVKFWLLGMGVALPLGLTNLLPAYGVGFYPLGNLGSVIWAAIVAYAIVRHRLMDIDIVVTKSIAYAGAIVAVVGPSFLITLGMQKYAFGEIHYDFSVGIAVLLTAAGILLPPLRALTEARLQRSLFPQKFGSRIALTTFAGSVVRILDREKLIRELCETIRDALGLETVALFVLEDVRGKLELSRSLGSKPALHEFTADHPFVRWLISRGEPVLREEALPSEPDMVRTVFRELNWEVSVPLVSNGVLLGFLGLGRKQRLEAYSAGDLELLRSVAVATAIALENARLYEELRRSRDIINRAGRLSALGTLAAGIAHEIRNPLVSIHTFFQLAPQRLNDEEFMTSFLSLAEGEVQRISSLITELLTFAKSPTTTPREMDINDVVSRSITLLAPQARAQHVELRCAEASELPFVLADPDQILQVVINIVLNAIQVSRSGSFVLVETRLVLHNSEAFSQIEIRDYGEGIPLDMQEAIFNPFFTTKEKGTGLGLPIAHRIVAESGGFITIDSIVGEGTRFFINLPTVVGDVVGLNLSNRAAMRA
jgi:signal transduction histidine kinase